jgi:hypothetical protein
VKVLCGEGVANHTAPESSAATREGRSEALTGDSVGQPLSGENQLRSADAFRPAEGNTGPCRNRETRRAFAGRRPPSCTSYQPKRPSSVESGRSHANH